MSAVAVDAAPATAPREQALEELSQARAEWVQLAERAGSVFATWEWADTWWRHFARDRPLSVRLLRDGDGTARAILPLYLARTGPVRVARLVGHGVADELGPVCAPADRPRAAGALARLVRELTAGRGVGLLERLPRDVPASALGGAVTLRRECSPVLSAEGLGWPQWLASRSANFRQQVRRSERALSQRHRVGLRMCQDAARLPADLDALFSLHRQRWDGAASPFAEPSAEAFHRDFAAVALRRGWLRLWLLELDGAPAAAWYGFRFADVEFFYQCGRDPRLRRDGVGFVLMVHSVRAALEDGVREYRLLRGGDAYKSRFADVDDGVQTLAVPDGPAARAALAAASRWPRLLATAGRLA